MKKLFFALFFLIGLQASAQKTADWSFPVEGKAVEIFKHNFTGVNVVETTKFYYGIDHLNGDMLWQSEKNATNEAVKTASKYAKMAGVGDADMYVDEAFQEIPFTPFVSMNNVFVDVSTGQVLMGNGTHDYRTIMSTNIIPELYVLLVQIETSTGGIDLLSIDLETKKVQWKKTLNETGSKAMQLLTAAVGQMAMFDDALTPKATKSEEIIYNFGDKLLLLDAKSGNTVWEKECTLGSFFLDKKQETLVVVEAKSMMSVSSVGLSKTIYALDLKSGKELWKKPVKLADKYLAQKQYNEEQFAVIHLSGVDLVNYKTGELAWKKPFDAKFVRDITFKEEGIEVFYKNKIMLVDAKTGKDAWKKPIKFDDMDEEEEGSVIRKDYEKGVLVASGTSIGLFNTETGKRLWRMGVGVENKVAFDNVNGKVAVLDKKKLYLFDPNAVEKKPEKLKLDINEHTEIIGFETRKEGYFITGMHEYIALNKKAELVDQKVFNQLKTDRLLKAALRTASIAGSMMSTQVTVGTGENAASVGVFMSTENAQKLEKISSAQYDAFRKLKEANKLRGKAVSDGQYAYFLEGRKADDGDVMELVKINKNTGKEEERFAFGNNRAVIYSLDTEMDQLYFVDEGKLQAFDL